MAFAIHMILHFAVPLLVALIFFRNKWWQTWLILSATMIVDLDHLLSTPVFGSDRCSIGYHLLHSYISIVIYFLLLFLPKARLVGIGLLIHMALDLIDCFRMGRINGYDLLNF